MTQEEQGKESQADLMIRLLTQMASKHEMNKTDHQNLSGVISVALMNLFEDAKFGREMRLVQAEQFKVIENLEVLLMEARSLFAKVEKILGMDIPVSAEIRQFMTATDLMAAEWKEAHVKDSNLRT